MFTKLKKKFARWFFANVAQVYSAQTVFTREEFIMLRSNRKEHIEKDLVAKIVRRLLEDNVVEIREKQLLNSDTVVSAHLTVI